MKFKNIVFSLALYFSCTLQASVGVLTPNEIESIIPSFWLDRTGFEFDNDQFKDIAASENLMIPLLPLYQKGVFGKSNYIGGVIETEYLQGLSYREKVELINRINSIKTSEGIPLQAIPFNNKIYAIRSDYSVILANVFTIGLNFQFGNSKTVILGDSTAYGVKIDFSGSLRINEEKGLNLTKNLQNIIDDWSLAFRKNQNELLINEAIRVSPVLMSYFSNNSTSLMSEDGEKLTPLKGENNQITNNGVPVPLSLSPNHTKEWNKIKKGLIKNLSKEIAWKETIDQQMNSEKIYSNPESNLFIQNICDRLATAYEVPREIWPECKISASLNPNAWAYPGGKIFITAGLLGILSEVDSVALVLGHEIAHVLARHGSKKNTSNNAYNYAASFISATINFGIAGFSLAGGMGTLGNVTYLTWYPQAMFSSMVGGTIASEGLSLLFFAPMAGLMLLSREFELQADRLGQEAAYTAGVDLEKMNQGWKEFIDYVDTYFPRNLGIKEKIMMDHPNSNDRLESFENQKSQLQNLLAESHSQNLIDDKMRSDYRLIHKTLSPYSKAFGRQIKKKLSSSLSPIETNRTNHFLNTLTGAHGKCIQYALGLK
ncbi:MAG: M48 family metalloprotease [Bacteriovoracaceae bacterium]